MNYPLIVFALGLTIAALPPRGDRAVTTTGSHAPWPTTFEGQKLQALPPSESEMAFAKNFPGTIATFLAENGNQVILRKVNRATRKLHDTATCLRASGFRITQHSARDGWTRYTASKGGESWKARSRIESETTHETWTEISSWYWHALFNPDASPWQAVTILEPG